MFAQHLFKRTANRTLNWLRFLHIVPLTELINQSTFMIAACKHLQYVGQHVERMQHASDLPRVSFRKNLFSSLFTANLKINQNLSTKVTCQSNPSSIVENENFFLKKRRQRKLSLRRLLIQFEKGGGLSPSQHQVIKIINFSSPEEEEKRGKVIDCWFSLKTMMLDGNLILSSRPEDSLITELHVSCIILPGCKWLFNEALGSFNDWKEKQFVGLSTSTCLYRCDEASISTPQLWRNEENDELREEVSRGD